ncbi:30S ribosomal protein S6 [Candidatus Marinimicrobia bacterium]|nr:30S ribosomal protein S6 [Candidatus Neomarinimicrobiota bacterium]|tara:strand:- start:3342 stop:3767 length:426 start_codon:yes stop_codon:yes gene_type:complete
MRYYELIYIVSSNVERKKNDQAMKEIGEKIQETGSKIINHIVWGKKKLAYPIKNNTYGTYILAHYQGGDNDKLREFDSWLKLSDLAIRHMIVKLDEKPDIVESLEGDKSENDTAEKGEDKSPDEESLKKEKNKDEENKEAE